MLNITAKRRLSKKNIELNIAPLIDMMFILLIFFLVSTSFVKETGVKVNRPVASTATNQKNANILIGITRDGRIFFDKREVDIRALRAYVERAIAESPESNVIIVADKRSETGVVIRAMDLCKLAGAKHIAIAATPPQGR